MFKVINTKISNHVNGYYKRGKLLCLAASKNDFETVRVLVSQYTNINYAPINGNDRGKTALWWAVKYNDIEMIALLKAAGANAHIAPPDAEKSGETLLWLANFNDSFDALKLLIEHSAAINIPLSRQGIGSHGHDTLLIWAAYRSNFDIVKLLVEHGADVNAAVTAGDDEGKTALWWATYNKNHAMVSLFFNKQVYSNAAAFPSLSTIEAVYDFALDNADNGYKTIVYLFIVNFPDLLMLRSLENNPLSHSCILSMLQWAISLGANIHVARTIGENIGKTAIMKATETDNIVAIKWLLTNGAQVDFKQTIWEQVLDVANSNLYAESIALIQNASNAKPILTMLALQCKNSAKNPALNKTPTEIFMRVKTMLTGNEATKPKAKFN